MRIIQEILNSGSGANMHRDDRDFSGQSVEQQANELRSVREGWQRSEKKRRDEAAIEDKKNSRRLWQKRLEELGLDFSRYFPARGGEHVTGQKVQQFIDQVKLHRSSEIDRDEQWEEDVEQQITSAFRSIIEELAYCLTGDNFQSTQNLYDHWQALSLIREHWPQVWEREATQEHLTQSLFYPYRDEREKLTNVTARLQHLLESEAAFMALLLRSTPSIAELQALLQPREFALIVADVPRREEELKKADILSQLYDARTVESFGMKVQELALPLFSDQQWLFKLEDTLLRRYRSLCEQAVRLYQRELVSSPLATRNMTAYDIHLQDTPFSTPDDQQPPYQDTALGESAAEKAYNRVFQPLQRLREQLQSLPHLQNPRFETLMTIAELEAKQKALIGQANGGNYPPMN